MGRFVMIAVALLFAPGCLVVTVNPTHERDELVWDPALVGVWQNVDDNSSVVIDKGEWQSYRLHYTHPIETGDLTGYLTRIGKVQFLDVMPARGEDRGSFLVPVHATLRLRLEGDRLEITALSYDWFFDRLKTKTGVPGLNVALDEKENALIVSPTAAVRAWIARQPPDGLMFGASATFTRKPGG
ncbi:MAG: hypothetical protein H0W08_25360 [Acidobacteria bacterium]|nr:hypothetical protein [Acidobacteriota bacterium]